MIALQLIRKRSVSQAIGVQFKLIAPPQHVALFGDRQLADKKSRRGMGPR
jgi:hypothetical protein